MNYATIKTDLAKASEIKDFIHAREITDEKYPYDYFDGEYEGVHVHACRNKKEIYSITFSSPNKNCEELARFFSSNVTIKETSATEKKSTRDCWEDLGPQIGSDEVGKGDFFGPLVVVASYVDSKSISFLEKYKINDSKKMKDEYILEIGPILKRNIKHHILILDAKKLSSLNEQHFNIDKVLSISHNFVQLKVKQKYDIQDNVLVYVDQFLGEENYKKYVANDLIANPLYFRTKGETYYPSVAVSSVIARYTFLKEWEQMEKVFQTKIPKGASALVDKVFGRLKNQFGQQAVDPYVKRFFANYKKSENEML